MKTRTSDYPIGKLLIKLLTDSGLSIAPFVLAIGYGNSNKGVKAFDRILTYGVPVTVFLDRLKASRFAPDPVELEQALEETRGIVEREDYEYRLALQEEARKSFRPFIQGVPELTTPTSITCFCFTGGHSRYTIPVPDDLPSWSLDAQHQYVKEAVKENFAACKGRTLYMGALTGYRLFRRYGEPAVFYTTEGEPAGAEPSTPLPEGTLTIGGKTLDSKQVQAIMASDVIEE